MIETIIAGLKDKGFRITPQRRSIVEKIFGKAAPLTALEIWELVRADHADVGLDTIYRNLNILVEQGVLATIAAKGRDGVRYEVAPHSWHHHHIVCIKCGQAACIDYCPISPNFMKLIGTHGYQLVRHNIELYGICGHCNTVKGDQKNV
jgi:Fe2+ or Zn2+ uptake regulation protein